MSLLTDNPEDALPSGVRAAMDALRAQPVLGSRVIEWRATPAVRDVWPTARAERRSDEDAGPATKREVTSAIPRRPAVATPCADCGVLMFKSGKNVRVRCAGCAQERRAAQNAVSGARRLAAIAEKRQLRASSPCLDCGDPVGPVSTRGVPSPRCAGCREARAAEGRRQMKRRALERDRARRGEA